MSESVDKHKHEDDNPAATLPNDPHLVRELERDTAELAKSYPHTDPILTETIEELISAGALPQFAELAKRIQTEGLSHEEIKISVQDLLSPKPNKHESGPDFAELMTVIRTYRKSVSTAEEARLTERYGKRWGGLPPTSRGEVMNRLSRSIQGTPQGLVQNKGTKRDELEEVLERLFAKYGIGTEAVQVPPDAPPSGKSDVSSNRPRPRLVAGQRKLPGI